MAEISTTALASDGNLQVYHRFEGNSTDSSPAGNNGTDTSITYSSGNGKYGQGAGFNGTTSIITLPDNFKYTGSFSILAWVNFANFSSFNGNNIFSSYRYDGTSYGYMLDVTQTTGLLQMRIFTGVGITNVGLTSSGALSSGQWHHIAMVRTGSTGTVLYIDGVQDGSNSSTTNPVNSGSAHYPSIGNRRYGAALFESPSAVNVDELAILNKALSANEVLLAFQESVIRFYTYKPAWMS